MYADISVFDLLSKVVITSLSRKMVQVSKASKDEVKAAELNELLFCFFCRAHGFTNDWII